MTRFLSLTYFANTDATDAAQGEVNCGAARGIARSKGCRFDSGPGASLTLLVFKARFYP